MENIITSKDNPVIKLYQKLSSSKKERLQYGLFVLEGLRIVEDALKEESGITIKRSEGYATSKEKAEFEDLKRLALENDISLFEAREMLKQ